MATKTWTGGGSTSNPNSGNWNTSGNWSPCGIPVANDDVAGHFDPNKTLQIATD